MKEEKKKEIIKYCQTDRNHTGCSIEMLQAYIYISIYKIIVQKKKIKCK